MLERTGVPGLGSPEAILEPQNTSSAPAIAAWRDGRRFEQGLERVALADDGMAAIPQGAVCLITGGFGGIGQAIARELASPLRVRARWLTAETAGDQRDRALRIVPSSASAAPCSKRRPPCGDNHQCLNFLDMVFGS